MSLKQELFERGKILENATFQDVTPRLLALLKWMEAQPEIKTMLEELRADSEVIEIYKKCGPHAPPRAATKEQIAGVGLAIVDDCAEQNCELHQIAWGAGVEEVGSSSTVIGSSHAAMERYVLPFFNFVLGRLPSDPDPAGLGSPGQTFIPVAIQESLGLLRADYPNPDKTAFIMMQFADTSAHTGIEGALKATLTKYGFTGLLARDKEYNEDLYANIQTYMHGCGFGIAVFDRIEQEMFNPNISLEVGYMLGLKKRVLLLKDKSLKSLHADLVGKLYKPFDVLNPAGTIPAQMEQWMEDKGLI
jgi:hypothetical protein